MLAIKPLDGLQPTNRIQKGDRHLGHRLSLDLLQPSFSKEFEVPLESMHLIVGHGKEEVKDAPQVGDCTLVPSMELVEPHRYLRQ